MKTVMVTGAAGFLGSHLMLHHIRAGDTVLGLDNYCSSRRDSDHVKLINKLGEGKSYVDSCDITDMPTMRWHSKKYLHNIRSDRFNVIYNFGCAASPPKYQAMPIDTMMTCTVGTLNVLTLAEQYGSILIHASTSEVYGDPAISPQCESHWGNVNSYGPRSCYDEGKRAAEALCYDHLHKHHTDARLVRIFNTYGEHMSADDGRVVSNFIVQALGGERLTVYGSGKQTRSFCYVDDLIRGIVSLGSLRKNPETPVNLGNPEEFTVLQLAQLIGDKVLGRGFDTLDCCVGKDLPVDDPIQRRPDISLANSLLGWSPEVSLNDGLDRTIEYFRAVVKL